MLAAYKGTTSISLVREALYGATQRGLDISLPLQQARIDPQLLCSANARVCASAFSRLWVALSDMLDDEFFAIDSHPLRRGSFRLMCHATIGCDSLEQALRRILAFLRLGLDDLYGELHLDGDSASIIIHDHGVERRLFSYGTWLILVHGLLCWLGNRRIPLQALSFRSPRPDDDSDYRMRFCEHIEFAAPATRLCFDACFLNLKVAQTPESLAIFLKESPASLLVKYRNDASLSAQIRQRLRNHTPENWPSLDDVANQLSMSSSTLQRRLQAEGVSYQGLKDNLRRDMAINFLGQSELTVCEVAAQAGFQETSAFHRAFKKWTGVSPGAYRRSSTDAVNPVLTQSAG
ncbi:AraC family transcriptional regulator [Pseudomonas alkylphenolica]|uniref:AraC family transcriptional regulator n=1 Tax=Pseudomonas TaxID=286 RepID=UPI0005EB66FB|nr:AraC family transcriptional regulator [Pseudomonas sp. 5]KJK07417.1 AraC family transcriptional regulator [Pseudomonas sp. 5]